MKKILIPILLIGTVISSCIREKTTVLEAWVYNNSSHQITILFYSNGVVPEGNTINLQPSDSFRMGLAAEMGDMNGPGFYSDYGSDSTIVIFDDEYSISHYVNTPDSLSNKYYLFESIRNLGNPNSYVFTRKKGKKGMYNNMHRYYFTEQDYLDAKD